MCLHKLLALVKTWLIIRANSDGHYDYLVINKNYIYVNKFDISNINNYNIIYTFELP